VRRASITKYKGGGSNNISVGVTASASGGSSSHTVATSGVTTQASGSTFVVCCSWYNTTTAPVITDNKSNSYTQIGTNVYNATDSTGFALFYCKGNGGSGHTFTGTSGAGTYLGIAVLEIKGSTGVIDQSNQGSAISGTGPAGSGSITTTNAHDIIVGAGYCDSEATSQAITIGSPLTAAPAKNYTSVSLGAILGYEIVSSTGTYSAAVSASPNGTFVGAAVTSFKST
jgi:hypothetical protein